LELQLNKGGVLRRICEVVMREIKKTETMKRGLRMALEKVRKK